MREAKCLTQVLCCVPWRSLKKVRQVFNQAPLYECLIELFPKQPDGRLRWYCVRTDLPLVNIDDWSFQSAELREVCVPG